MNIDEFNYILPKDRIAQKPIKNRSDSKLMISSKVDYSNKDDYFYNLCNYLHKNDLIIFNNTIVIQQTFGKKLTRKVEIFEKKFQIMNHKYD